MTLPKYFHFGVQQLLLQFYLFPISIIQSYDDSLGLSQNCKDHCDKHRGGGWSLEYEFNCDEIYHSNPSEKNLCRSSCQLCPDSVCNSKTPNIFKCPRTDIDGDCKKRCDSNRKYGYLHGLIINCTEAYDSSSEIEDCKQNCGQCPDWVCNDEIDPNTFYCPIGTYDGKCREICERYDQSNIGITVDLVRHFGCDQEPRWKDECKLTCVDCPVMVCDHTKDDNKYQCSLNPHPIPLTTTTTTTTPGQEHEYEGPCKERCDKLRFGETKAFSFNCDKAFKTQEEKDKCYNDCKHYCPSDVCFTWTRPDDSDYFQCPASDDHKDVVEKKDHTLTGLIVAVIFAAIFGVWAIIVTILYCQNRNKAVKVMPGMVQQVQSFYQQNPDYVTPQVSSQLLTTTPVSSASSVGN